MGVAVEEADAVVILYVRVCAIHVEDFSRDKTRPRFVHHARQPSRHSRSDACKDVVVQRSFSNKPKTTGAFADFFDKIESYVAIISGPAIEKYGVSPYTFRVVAHGFRQYFQVP